MKLSKKDLERFKYENHYRKKKKQERLKAKEQSQLLQKQKKTEKKLEEKTFLQRKKEYYDYLDSDKWKSIKSRLFILLGKYCERCGSKERIQVHHITYERLFNERFDDLEILCENCHKKEHGK